MNMNIYTHEEMQKEKEKSFLLAVKIAQDAFIPFPQNVDSQLWNQRIHRLVDNLIVQFEMDGENQ